MAGGNRNYLHVATTQSTLVSGNSGVILASVVINTASAGTGGTLLIYDDTSAVAAHLIASCNTNNSAIPALEYLVVMSRGIFIVFTQGGTTAGDLTITYI